MKMFGFIIVIIVLSSIFGLFSRAFSGYYRRPRINRFGPFGGYGGFGGWGMGMRGPYDPMFRGGPHCHNHHHPMGRGRRW